jgi:hypothetical protein
VWADLQTASLLIDPADHQQRSDTVGFSRRSEALANFLLKEDRRDPRHARFALPDQAMEVTRYLRRSRQCAAETSW